jgi:Family of unknown function (DUF6370)
MRAALFAATLILSVAFSGTAARAADEAKAKPEKAAAGEVTRTGEMVCGKCSLKEGDKCQNVLKVTEADKETKYYLVDNKVAKDNHEKVCSGPAKATVTGKVKEAKGKKTLTAASIKYE